jgi:hypothetical protein
MKLMTERINKRGKRVVTVELDAGEKLIGIKDGCYYRLGGQIDDIVQSHVITELEQVYWCSITQDWRPA